jgi:hypothetical protein
MQSFDDQNGQNPTAARTDPFKPFHPFDAFELSLKAPHTLENIPLWEITTLATYLFLVRPQRRLTSWPKDPVNAPIKVNS